MPKSQEEKKRKKIGQDQKKKELQIEWGKSAQRKESLRKKEKVRQEKKERREEKGKMKAGSKRKHE